MNALNLVNVGHEDVICRLFPYTLEGKATKCFFNLALKSITSWQKFEEEFITQFSDEETSGFELLGTRMN